ncbi:glycosyltransferase [Siphonobacter sp. BAB-5385]|nr:glycosyltransferase [Siphonobacter sp. BAB-5385]
MSNRRLKKKKIISIDVSAGKYSTIVDEIISLAASSTSSYTCVANVHMLVEAYNDPLFATVVNDASIVTSDGMPLAWCFKLLYNVNQDRVAGMDLLPDLIKICCKKDIPIFVYGGTSPMLQRSAEFFRKNFPTLKVAGMYSPPFRPLTPQEDLDVIDMINSSGAGLVFVALGCPKQEKWMASMHGKINASMIGIGGALPVFVGMQKRAPVWMQKTSLEWLYRLGQEPKRLFKRYFVTNTTMILLLIKELYLNRKKVSV